MHCLLRKDRRVSKVLSKILFADVIVTMRSLPFGLMVDHLLLNHFSGGVVTGNTF